MKPVDSVVIDHQRWVYPAVSFPTVPAIKQLDLGQIYREAPIMRALLPSRPAPR